MKLMDEWKVSIIGLQAVLTADAGSRLKLQIKCRK
jgi:hypothetical protein